MIEPSNNPIAVDRWEKPEEYSPESKLNFLTLSCFEKFEPVTSTKNQGFINLDYICLVECVVAGFFYVSNKAKNQEVNLPLEKWTNLSSLKKE